MKYNTQHGETTVEKMPNGGIFICDKYGSINVGFLLGWSFDQACKNVAAGEWRNFKP